MDVNSVENTTNQGSQVEIALDVAGLSCIRNDQLLFDDLDFSVSSGEVMQIDGPNGSGKTSLLRIISGLATPETGQIKWKNTLIQDTRAQLNNDLVYIGHSNGIKKELTPIENLRVARALSSTNFQTSDEEALDYMGLSTFADVPVRKLSSGQRRRVTLSRLLTIKARLWLLDEPFNSLDEDSRQLVKDMICHHSDTGGITIMVTHEQTGIPDDKLKKIML